MKRAWHIFAALAFGWCGIHTIQVIELAPVSVLDKLAGDIFVVGISGVLATREVFRAMAS